MNYKRYKRPISNPIKIIVTDKMKRTIEEADKYWEKIELKLKQIMTSQDIDYIDKIAAAKHDYSERNGDFPDSVIVPHFVYTHILESFTSVDSHPDPKEKVTCMGLTLIPNFDRDYYFKCIKSEL